MSQLNKKLTRDMATHWAQVSAIVIVIALGIVMFSGPLLAQRDLRDSINMVYRRTLYEDFATTVNSMPSSAISSVAGVPNVKAAEGRLTRDLLATVKHHQLTVRVISVPATGRPSVNGLIVESGRYPPEGQGEAAQAWCVAEHHMTSQFGLAPGDTISVQGASGPVSLKMSGSVVSPEYLRRPRSVRCCVRQVSRGREAHGDTRHVQRRGRQGLQPEASQRYDGAGAKGARAVRVEQPHQRS